MGPSQPGEHAPVRIEVENEWAWCGERRLELMPRAFAVLRHLVAHPGRLITKDELLASVWGDTIVSESALTSCIRDLRKALGDSSRTPRYIETVHRRGFRFVGPTAGSGAAASGAAGSAPAAEVLGGRLEVQAPPSAARPTPTLVGREAELAHLQDLLQEALAGRRRLVFVTGEAGIGKTTLIETFLARIGAEEARVARGQCVEQYGAGEAYLPVLEALGRLGREAQGQALVRILMQVAPTWLAQLPALLTDQDLEAVQRRAQGTTRARMLRELIEALDALSLEAPLVLVLEDLHWSDSATIDVLAMMARRRDPARLLVLGTYRPVDVSLGTHPLKAVKQELQLHGDCAEVVVDFLTPLDVAEYLGARFPRNRFPSRFARILHQSTTGNPLFLVNMLERLIAREELRDVDGEWELSVPVDDVAAGVPQTLWQMVEQQIERLTPPEQAMLAVGCVAGAEFSTALAPAGGIDVHDGEECCATLARRGQFLRAIGVTAWPDGTVAGRYAFIHALYRNVLYDRISIGHRVGLHLRIADLLERAHGQRAGEIAGELAMHFERSRDLERAVRYRSQAADAALRQHGYREAADHSTRAIELLAELPEAPERIQQELTLHTLRGAALIATGWAAPEVARTYARARELCTRAGVTPELFPVLNGLFGFYVTRAELGVARELAEQLSMMAKTTDDTGVLLGAHNAAGMASFYGGDFVAALAHLEQGIEVYDPERHNPNRSPAFWGGHDAGVSCAVHAAFALWVLGHPDRAAARMQQALTWARSISHPFTLAFACHFAAAFHQCRREVPAVRELGEAGITQSTEHGFELLLCIGAVHRGWLLCEEGRGEEGAAEIRSGLAAYREKGAGFGLPTFLALLAEAYEKLERPAEGLSVVAEALAMGEDTGSLYWDAELQRLKGALTLQSGAKGRHPASQLGEQRERSGADPRTARESPSPAEREAESCFIAAIDIARRRKAKSFELRAAMSLSRLWAAQGRAGEAHASLSGIYDWFTEGLDTPDLRDARALLEQLAQRSSVDSRVGSRRASPAAPAKRRRRS
jgi:DNA-binding winged helix-turn-helix (wHTH) protein/predicted ATPase